MKLIAIYGLSTETEKVIPTLSLSFHIVGLLDGFRTAGEMFGYPIISLDEALDAGVEQIIVVARPGSCKAIANRIGDFCKKQEIALVDIRGDNLLKEKKVNYNCSKIKGYRYKELIDKIQQADVISFDLFDTLIMRNVLYSNDVIEILNIRLQEEGIIIDDFVNKRIGLEKALSQGHAPKLSFIYKKLLDNELLENVDPMLLTNKEFEIEKNIIVARRDMVEILNYAILQGKAIVITSDSYYTREQIDDLLKIAGIHNYDQLFISCEYNTGKSDCLFDFVNEANNSRRILHIGDDLLADINAAKNHNIDVFQIYSSAELFDKLGGLGIETYIKSLSDRIRIGLIIARIFNSPFVFEEEQMISETNASDIGFIHFASLIIDFVMWMHNKEHELDIDQLLLCSRDGYLIKKIYENMYKEYVCYFYTSRTSSIRAGVLTKEDVNYVESMRFSGTNEDNLRKRFGIEMDSICQENIAPMEQGIIMYWKEIISRANEKKTNNQKYINSLELGKGKKAIFDFVAKGTSQMFLEKIMNEKLIGFYFQQLDKDFMTDKNLNIYSFYSDAGKEKSAFFDNYYILETILTSPEPSVNEFDENGNPVFAEETRNEKDINCIMSVQEGIYEYTKLYCKICPDFEKKINKELDEELLRMIHYVNIKDKDFLELTVEDQFFNRMTSIKDLL